MDDKINFSIESDKDSDTPIAIVKVVGVGGGGTNMVNRIATEENKLPITLIAANTDLQHLQESLADEKIQLGSVLTKGLGAGMKPEVGEASAIESEEIIREALKGSDIVFIAAGLGGGTGTGAAPIIAKIVKELEILSISIVTTPFVYEGRKRLKFAEKGLAELKEHSDSMIVVPNSKLSSVIDRNVGYKDAFRIVDDILYRAVYGICSLIFSKSAEGMNIDFQDLKTIMSYKGTALMGTGQATGENSALDAIKKAIESPLFDNASLKGATGVLVHYQIHPDYSFMALEEAMNYVYKNVNEDLDDDEDLMFGTTINHSLEIDEVQVTIVATGFDKTKEKEDKAKQEEKVHQERIQANQETTKQTNQTADKKPSTISKKINDAQNMLAGDLSDVANNLELPSILRKE